MTKQRGLGKGLGALLGEAALQTAEPPSGAQLLPLQKVEPNPLQPRKNFDPDELQALIAPTTIVQIVDGERVETEDKLFLLSKTQVFGKGRWSEREPEDAQLLCFLREKDRVKECGDNGTWFWWLRSPEASSSSSFAGVSSGGYGNGYYASSSYGVAFGFCLI